MFVPSQVFLHSGLRILALPPNWPVKLKLKYIKNYCANVSDKLACTFANAITHKYKPGLTEQAWISFKELWNVQVSSHAVTVA